MKVGTPLRTALRVRSSGSLQETKSILLVIRMAWILRNTVGSQAVRSSRDISGGWKRMGAAMRQLTDLMKIGGSFRVVLGFEVGFEESELLLLVLPEGEGERIPSELEDEEEVRSLDMLSSESASGGGVGDFGSGR